MRHAPTRHVILALAASACLVVVPSCGDNEARISFNAHASDGTAPHVRVSWETSNPFGYRTNEFELDELDPSAGPYQTGQTGTIQIDFVVLDGSTPSSTGGYITLELKKDWEWVVDFIIADSDPRPSCFGCIGSRSYDLDPALGYGPAYKLYLVWGGNSIKNPVVY